MSIFGSLDLLNARALLSIPLVKDLASIKNKDIAAVEHRLGYLADNNR